MSDAKATQMRMQDLRSLNFEPLRAVYPELANMGGHAEHYAHSDPESALVKLRNFAERVVDHIYTRLKLARAPQSNFSDPFRHQGLRCAGHPAATRRHSLARRCHRRVCGSSRWLSRHGWQG